MLRSRRVGPKYRPVVLDWLTAEVINVAGIVLQLVGVTIAVLGVSRLHRDLTARSIGEVVWASIVEPLRSWRNRKNVTAVSGVATGSVSVSGVGIVSNPDEETMPDDPPGQIAYLHRIVMRLEDRIRDVSESSKKAHNSLRSEVDATAERLREEIAEVSAMVAEIRVAVGGGPSGEGLRWAAGGLLLTLAGIALTLLAAV
jgi:hypothetical protein